MSLSQIVKMKFCLLFAIWAYLLLSICLGQIRCGGGDPDSEVQADVSEIVEDSESKEQVPNAEPHAVNEEDLSLVSEYEIEQLKQKNEQLLKENYAWKTWLQFTKEREAALPKEFSEYAVYFLFENPEFFKILLEEKVIFGLDYYIKAKDSQKVLLLSHALLSFNHDIFLELLNQLQRNEDADELQEGLSECLNVLVEVHNSDLNYPNQGIVNAAISLLEKGAKTDNPSRLADYLLDAQVTDDTALDKVLAQIDHQAELRRLLFKTITDANISGLTALLRRKVNLEVTEKIYVDNKEFELAPLAYANFVSYEKGNKLEKYLDDGNRGIVDKNENFEVNCKILEVFLEKIQLIILILEYPEQQIQRVEPDVVDD